MTRRLLPNLLCLIFLFSALWIACIPCHCLCAILNPLLRSALPSIDTRDGHLGFNIKYGMIHWILTVISGMDHVLLWQYSIPSAFLVLQAASLALGEGHSGGTQIWTKTYVHVLKLSKLWVPGQWSPAATEDIKRGKKAWRSWPEKCALLLQRLACLAQ